MRTMCLLALVACAAALAPYSITMKEADRVKGEYIVVFHDSITDSDRAAHMDVVSKAGAKVQWEYKHTIKGYSASMSEAALATVRAHNATHYVEENQIARIDQSCTTQDNVQAWGLDRISHCHPNAGDRTDSYVYPSQAGEGVQVYVIDTGSYCGHNEFGSRCQSSPNFVGDATPLDCNGHGTHVAGTIAGTLHGVAKQAAIIGVKVLGCGGSGSYAGVIAGVDWVAANHDESQGAGVANLSLGGGASSALDDALAKCVEDGILPVVAAGNSNTNACSGSPSRGDAVMTVGATSEPPAGGQDARASFSNYGPCVDLQAPGVSILAAYSTCNSNGGGCSSTATSTLSGTSMASPHAAGIAALLIGQNSYPGTPAGVRELECAIDSHGWKDLVNMNCNGNTVCEQTCNAMISTSYSQCGDQPGGECQWPDSDGICRCVDKAARKQKGQAAVGEAMRRMA